MSDHFRKPFCSVVVLLLVLACTCACNRSPTVPQRETVNVATNLPLTGELASYGKAVQRGVTMAVDDVQQTDPGAPIMHFDWQDNGGSPQAAVSIMQQQYLKSPDIYVSGVKPQTAAIADQISARGTPHFEWVFDAFINAKAHNNLRTWLSFKIEPDIFLKYAQLRQAKRVAVAYVQLPNTQEEYLQFVIPGLKKQGIQDKGIFVEAYPIATQDFKTLAVKIRDFHPDLIILNGFQDNLVGLVRALRALSAITDGNTIASYDMLDAAQVLGSDEIEGIRAAAPIFATRPDRPEIAQWRVRFEKRFSRQPIYTDAFGYDMAMIIHDSSKRVHLPATNQQWLEALRSTNISGVTGTLKFDDNGDLITPVEAGVYRNGTLVPIAK